jgi:hypothetical protein
MAKTVGAIEPTLKRKASRVPMPRTKPEAFLMKTLDIATETGLEADNVYNFEYVISNAVLRRTVY